MPFKVAEQDLRAKSANLQALLYLPSFLIFNLILICEQRFSILLKNSGQPLSKFLRYLVKGLNKSSWHSISNFGR